MNSSRRFGLLRAGLPKLLAVALAWASLAGVAFVPSVAAAQALPGAGSRQHGKQFRRAKLNSMKLRSRGGPVHGLPRHHAK
jgi:hypothetical protein